MNDLLNLLKKNARLTNAQLADMLGLTEKDVAAEIAALEKKGVIRGYTTIINEELTKSDEVEALIELRVTPKHDTGFEDVDKTIMMYDEVEQCSYPSACPRWRAFWRLRPRSSSSATRTRTSSSRRRSRMKGVCGDEL